LNDTEGAGFKRNKELLCNELKRDMYD